VASWAHTAYIRCHQMCLRLFVEMFEKLLKIVSLGGDRPLIECDEVC
jgi:hypothetical protein